MLLIHPPVSKPSEPPPGIARLAGAFKQFNVPCSVWDANLEGLLWLMRQSPESADTWTSRAQRHMQAHLDLLRNHGGYGHFDRYTRAVGDLNRLLEQAGMAYGARAGLSNFHHDEWSPVRSGDLLRAAEVPDASTFFPFFSKELLPRVCGDPHGVVGFSLNFLSQALTTFAMIGFLRREAPSVRVVLGGGLVTSWMRRPSWRNPFEGLVDSWVDGPGESRLLSLLRGEVTSVGHVTPDYTPFPLADYLSPGLILPYSASTGCYWNKCSFCPEQAEGNRYIPIGPDRVRDDLGRLLEAAEPVLIHFVDSALSPSLLEMLCRNPPGVSWHGFARITKHLTDAQFCRDLRRSGCVLLELGVESGSQDVLEKEGKGIRVEEVSVALRRLRDAGIATYVYLLFGTPSESEAQARRTLEFTVDHIRCIDFLNVAIFNLPIHGKGAQFLETKSHYEGDLSLYTGFSHPKGWSRGRVRQFIDKEFKRQPAIASILRRDPPHFTSNHAPFFCC
ncbi:MAG: radical SAM protein [Syntrophobacteraceae bacterium]